MRSAVTRIGVLLVGVLLVSLALLSNLWLSSVGLAAGIPSGDPTGSAAATVTISTPRPSAAPVGSPEVVASAVPTPSLPVSGVPVPTPMATPWMPETTPKPGTAPPAPQGEADDCPRPPSNVRLATVLSHGNEDDKVVALTFDDGFDPKTTRKILDVLQRYHVNATFFPTGRAILGSPGVWRDIVAAGFPIGDHTHNHPTLSDLCYRQQLTELQRQARAVRSTLRIPVQPYMRPPYEAWNRTTRIATTAAGQQAVVLWNIDTRDWAGSTVKTITRRALHGENGAIVLMHTTVGDTAIALPDIIRGYLARGFRFVTIGQLLGIDGPVPYP